MIQTLKLENFTRIKKLDLDFSDKEEIAIIGKVDGVESKSNGASKSSLVNSLVWITYGKVPGLYNKELIGPFGDKMRGELVMKFPINGKDTKIKIDRIYTNNKVTLNLSVNDIAFSGTKQQTQIKIIELLGCDLKVFLNTRFFMQEKSKTFLMADPAEREKFLTEFFDLSIYTKCHKLVAKKIKDFTEKEYVNDGELESATDRVRELKGQFLKRKKDEVKTKGVSAKEQIEKITERMNERKEYLDSISEHRNKVKQLRKDVANVKDNLQNAEDNAKEIGAEVKDLRREIANREASALKAKEEIKAGKKIELEDTSELSKSIMKMKEELASVKTQVADEKERITKLKDSDGGLCPLCEAALSPEKRGELVDSYSSSVETSQKKAGSLASDAKALEQKLQNTEHANDKLRKVELVLEKKKQQVLSNTEYINDKLKSIDGKIDKKHKLENDGLEHVKNLKAIKGKILKVTSNIDEVKENRFENEILEMSTKAEELNKTRLALSGEWGRLKALISEQSAAQTKLDGLQEIQGQLQSVRRRYEILEELFGRKGLASLVIRQLVMEIEFEANKVLESMQYGDYEVMIDCEKETNDGDLKQSIEIMVNDDLNIKRRIETFSGGEKAVINFAIRIALSDIMSRKHNVNFSGGFLDEVFAQIDPNGRDVMTDVLGYIRKNFFFDQIFLISHTELKDSLKDCLLIEKNNGVAKARFV